MTRVGVDVGGTFTDLVALEPDGTIRITKVRSTPADPARGLWAALDAAPDVRPEIILHAEGFEDLLWLRRQDRAGLYDLSRHHSPPPVERADVIGVAERMGPKGVVRPLTDGEIERVVGAVRALTPEAVAVAFLFSFRDPVHEQRVAEALRRALPDCAVVPSAEVLPVFREYERTSTTVAEAFLRPTIAGYVERLAGEAQRRGIADVRIMASNGGTLSPEHAQKHATALALSGPAAGVEGARLVGELLGERNLLTLDMGGTSADASVIVDGAALAQSGGAIGGIPLALPNTLIETVGAGGGSIAWVDSGGALRVGPHSAGAEPGPACYGRGGTDATVTDAVLVLGWLDANRPLASELRLDPAAARDAVERVAKEAGLDPAHCAEGIVDIAVATMVRALRRVSVERGLDPRSMTLVPFGGAGPLFTCRLAESLGMTRAVVPPHPGVLSAVGLAAASERVEAVRSVHRFITDVDAAVWDTWFATPERQVTTSLAGTTVTRFAECRYPGQGYELSVPANDGPTAVTDAFHRIHAERYGHADVEREVEVVNVRVVGTREGGMAGWRKGVEAGRREGGKAGGSAGMDAATVFEGPTTIALADATVRIEDGWQGAAHESGALIVTCDAIPPSRPPALPPC